MRRTAMAALVLALTAFACSSGVNGGDDDDDGTGLDAGRADATHADTGGGTESGSEGGGGDSSLGPSDAGAAKDTGVAETASNCKPFAEGLNVAWLSFASDVPNPNISSSCPRCFSTLFANTYAAGDGSCAGGFTPTGRSRPATTPAAWPAADLRRRRRGRKEHPRRGAGRGRAGDHQLMVVRHAPGNQLSRSLTPSLPLQHRPSDDGRQSSGLHRQRADAARDPARAPSGPLLLQGGLQRAGGDDDAERLGADGEDPDRRRRRPGSASTGSRTPSTRPIPAPSSPTATWTFIANSNVGTYTNAYSDTARWPPAARPRDSRLLRGALLRQLGSRQQQQRGRLPFVHPSTYWNLDKNIVIGEFWPIETNGVAAERPLHDALRRRLLRRLVLAVRERRQPGAGRGDGVARHAAADAESLRHAQRGHPVHVDGDQRRRRLRRSQQR